MGNLKISKAKKNKGSKGSSGIPNWLLSLLVVLVIVAVIATCVSTYIATSGITLRWSTAMSVGNYKVNGSMMKYYYQTTYDNYINQQYSSFQQYSQYLGETSFEEFMSSNIGFNVGVPHDQQEYKADDEGDNKFGTWQDYFLAQTESSVEELLLYCAEADALGVSTLDEEDKKELEAQLDEAIAQLRSNLQSQGLQGLSEGGYISYYYGEGVKEGDIRDSMRLSMIASKASEKINEKIEGEISDELIQSTYDENKLDYDLVDYFGFEFDVKYDDVVKELYEDKTSASLDDSEKAEALELYKKKIAEARASAKELAACTTLEEFQKYAVKYTANKSYDEKYDSAVTDMESGFPSTTDLETIKEKMIAAVIAEINEGKDSAIDDVVTVDEANTIYGLSITPEFAEAAKTLKSELFNVAYSAKEDNLFKKVNYSAPNEETGEKDELSEWAFNSERKANDVTTIENGDGANKTEAEVTVEEESFSAEVILLVKPSYLDESLSRNFAYMLFTDEEKAKAALEAVKSAEELDKDKFLNIAKEKESDANTFLEDCWEGNMGTAIDEWLFSAEAGTYTDELLVMEDGSFFIGLYTSENTVPAWKNSVKNHIYEEKFTDYESKMKENYSVEKNEKAIAKIFA